MIHWFCGRCKTFVNYLGWRLHGEDPCKCDPDQPLPLWYVPMTFFQKLRCKFKICKYKGTCNTCDKGPYNGIPRP